MDGGIMLTSHNLVTGLRSFTIIKDLEWYIYITDSVRSAVHPWSHIRPIESSESEVREGIMYP